MTPLERAAHALRLADDCDFHEAETKDYEGMVRAVLTAIREPSEGMLNADGGEDERWDDVFVRSVWRAMIDALLAEGE